MTNLTQQPVVVEQAARDAAADWMVDGEGLVEAYRSRIKEGSWDAEQIVQAFQCAINAERERCAKVAELEAANWRASVVGGSLGYAMNAERAATSIDSIATAIRSGKEPAA